MQLLYVQVSALTAAAVTSTSISDASTDAAAAASLAEAAWRKQRRGYCELRERKRTGKIGLKQIEAHPINCGGRSTRYLGVAVSRQAQQ